MAPCHGGPREPIPLHLCRGARVAAAFQVAADTGPGMVQVTTAAYQHMRV